MKKSWLLLVVLSLMTYGCAPPADDSDVDDTDSNVTATSRLVESQNS